LFVASLISKNQILKDTIAPIAVDIANKSAYKIKIFKSYILSKTVNIAAGMLK